MKRKKIVTAVIILMICIAAVIFIRWHKIDSTFTYEIDKDNGTVTITGYLGDDRARERNNVNPDFPEKIEIPASIKGYPVTAIGDNAFTFALAKEIVMPDTVRKIGDEAFLSCIYLETIKGTEHVEVIGKFAFSKCVELQELYLPCLVEIGERAFSENDKMQEIIIPDTVKVIPEYMCAYMDGITKVEIPEGVESIGECAFSGCNSLEEIYIPASVTQISPYAFSGIEGQITIFGEKGSYAEWYASEISRLTITFCEVNQ